VFLTYERLEIWNSQACHEGEGGYGLMVTCQDRSEIRTLGNSTAN